MEAPFSVEQQSIAKLCDASKVIQWESLETELIQLMKGVRDRGVYVLCILGRRHYLPTPAVFTNLQQASSPIVERAIGDQLAQELGIAHISRGKILGETAATSCSGKNTSQIVGNLCGTLILS